MIVLSNETMPEIKRPVKIWVEHINDVEDEALKQIMDLTSLPFTFKHVAIMPDVHPGYGMPIGGVLATKNVVIPNAVGVDIGCGMHAVKTSLTEIDRQSVKQIMKVVREFVPLGFDHHDEKSDAKLFNRAPDIQIIQSQLDAARYQLGTLGGGNHFIEIQMGSDGHIWYMIHSGSRNFGYKIAKEYHKIAEELCYTFYSSIPNRDLSFLPLGVPQGREYIEAMNYALDFAHENRRAMAEWCTVAFQAVDPDMQVLERHDVHHNYATLEHHFGHNVYVHRKGATRVREDEIGIIPGSQGSTSYIVRGKGNPESYCSCSHGAGRRMGRKEAQRTLSLEEEQSRLNDLGVVHSVRHESDLDEAAGAYKDISTVMKNQEDLVEILVELRPLGVIKG